MNFTVYTKPACPQCDQAKALLQQKGYTYESIHLDVGQPKVEGERYIVREELLKVAPGARMMPVVVGPEGYIGSLPELRKLLS